MRRFHLIEIEDLGRCPAWLRAFVTDALQAATGAVRPFDGFVPLLRDLARRAGTNRFVDFGSGSGGPWPHLVSAVSSASDERTPLEVWLTDRYPHANGDGDAPGPRRTPIVRWPQPVDARHVPENWRGVRTFFCSFHHLPPDDARAVLRDTVRRGDGIAVFEVTHRSALAMLLMIGLPLFTLLLTPFIRPFRWSRLFWTYAVPVVPLVVLFDAVVSCLRTYSPDDLRALVAHADDGSYAWEIRQVEAPHSPIPITVLVGAPGTPRTMTNAPGRVESPGPEGARAWCRERIRGAFANRTSRRTPTGPPGFGS